MLALCYFRAMGLNLTRYYSNNLLLGKSDNGCRVGLEINRIWGSTGTQSYYVGCQEPFHPIAGKIPLYKSGDDAVSVIKSGWFYRSSIVTW